jgi:membrane associated rhomboid family serine protease
MKFFALNPIQVSVNELSSNFYIWQLITYQFMHGGFMHLFFNMLALWMFGAELESLWGSRKFLIYYLLCGIGAGLVQLFISPLFSNPAPTIGASGAIYGILVAFGMTFPNRTIMMFPIFFPIPAKIFVILFAGMELLNGLNSSDGVAHFAHLGGAVMGVLLLVFGERMGLFRYIENLFKSKETKIGGYGSSHSYGDSSGSFGSHVGSGHFTNTPTAQQPRIIKSDWRKTTEAPRQETVAPTSFNVFGEEINQKKIDDILDKISANGYQSLTEREKTILNELSKKLR